MPSAAAAATRLLLFADDSRAPGPGAVKLRRYRIARLTPSDVARRGSLEGRPVGPQRARD